MSRIENALPIAIRKIPNLLCSPIRPYMVRSTVPTFLNHLTIASDSAFFSSKKNTHTHKTFSLSLKIFRKHFSFFLPQRLCTQYSSVSFAWNVFQLIPHDWFFLSLLLQLKCHLQGGRDYLIITLKGHRRYPVTLLFFPYKYKIHAFACLATHNEL